MGKNRIPGNAQTGRESITCCGEEKKCISLSAVLNPLGKYEHQQKRKRERGGRTHTPTALAGSWLPVRLQFELISPTHPACAHFINKRSLFSPAQRHFFITQPPRPGCNNYFLFTDAMTPYCDKTRLLAAVVSVSKE